MNNAEVESYKLFVQVAKESVARLKPGKVAFFDCPACKAKALAKKSTNGIVRAYCQGCGIKTP